MRHRAGSGSELADWMEVWCFRCRHDHGLSHGPENETGDGCAVMAEAMFSYDHGHDALIDSGYVIEYRDPDGRVDELLEHDIPDVYNSLPAATFCTKWEPCEPDCMRHVNGAVIVNVRRAEVQP